MKKNIVKNFSQFIIEAREFDTPHGDSSPIFTFFERVPGVGMVKLGIVYSGDEDDEGEFDTYEALEILDREKYSSEEIYKIEKEIESLEMSGLIDEIIQANKARGIRTVNPY